MKKSIVILFFFTIIISTTLSQNIKKTEDVGNLLSKNLCTRGDFTQKKYIPNIKRTLISSGKFLISSENGILWDTEQPFSSIMIVGEDYIAQGSSKDSIQVMEAGNNRLFMEISKAISSVFAGNITQINNSFNVELNTNNEEWSLLLIPKEPTLLQVIKSITLIGKDNLQEIILEEHNESIITYIFSNHTFSQELTQDEKEFFIKK